LSSVACPPAEVVMLIRNKPPVVVVRSAIRVPSEAPWLTAALPNCTEEVTVPATMFRS
jgi:hypothetical protein